MKKRAALVVLLVAVVAYCLCQLTIDLVGRFSKPNQDYLRIAEEATTPHFNFMFASNASLAGRIFMTLTDGHKPCINTVTSFYNKYHTCSNCEDFEKNPGKWGFEQTTDPKVGDILIQHNAETGRAYHACIIVDIKDGKYYLNHAVRTNYIKNAELKNTANLTFYRFLVR